MVPIGSSATAFAARLANTSGAARRSPRDKGLIHARFCDHALGSVFAQGRSMSKRTSYASALVILAALPAVHCVAETSNTDVTSQQGVNGLAAHGAVHPIASSSL